MKAIVLAGGEGTRLRPLTIGRPKPLVPLVNRPILGHILALLRRHRFGDVVIATSYRAAMIQNYFRGETIPGLHIRFSVEDRPLGTAGAVRHARSFLDDTFLVISGDVLTDIDLSALVDFHHRHDALVTMALYHSPTPLEYGVVVTDGEGRIHRFLEKPSWGEVMSDTINAGIYVVDPAVLDLIPPNTPSDWSQDIFPMLLARYPNRVYGYATHGYWTDIGTIPEYVRAVDDILTGRIDVGPLGEAWAPDVWVGEDVEIAPNVRIEGPVYLGHGVKIRDGAVIVGPTVVRDYSFVDSRARIVHSIIWRNSYIGESAELTGAIVGRRCAIKANAVIFEGAVIGDETTVGEGAIIHLGVKIWPNKEVEPGAIVRSSIVWGTRARRRLFGRFGITGVVNVDLTPEFCAKLGATIGATLPPGSHVIMNRDPHRSSRMLKRALIAGLPSAGVNVWDVHSVPIPVARYYTRVTEAVAGLHVRLSPFNARIVDIRVFGADGIDLGREDEQRIERIFFREDYRRAYLDDIGIISDAPNVLERYQEDFFKHIDKDVFKQASFSIVVDYSHSTTVDVLPAIFSALGVDVIPLNAHIDESKIALHEDLQEMHQQHLATIVRALHKDLGIQLDVGGEKIVLVDDRGEILPSQVAALAVIDLVMRYQTGKAIVVPLTMTGKVEKVVGFHGGYVIRTRYDLHDIMQRATEPDVILATDGRGHFIFPEFQPVVDGLFASVKVLELMGRYTTHLSVVLSQVPPFHVYNGRVDCPWEKRGKVMRLLAESVDAQKVENMDGIKAWFDEETWVLVRPDPDHPLFHVDAEARTAVEAQALVREYVRRIEELSRLE